MTSPGNTVSQVRPTGRVLTVQGPIEPANVGVTTTHEHLFIDFTPVLTPPVPATEMALMHEEVGIENLGWVRYHWTSNIDNLQLLDEDLSIREAGHYYRGGRRHGGRRDLKRAPARSTCIAARFKGNRIERGDGRRLLR